MGHTKKELSMTIAKKDLFEDTPIIDAVMKLAVPTVIGQIILVIYNMADTFFIGLTDNNAKITAVTICMPAFMFLSAVANLFGVGGSSVISKALGKSNMDRGSWASAFSFWGCLLLTLVYSLLAYLLRNPFVNFLGGLHADVHAYAVQYLIITVVLGGLFTAMNNLMSHLVRSEGRSLHASLGVAMGGILNIALDPLFMFVILPPGNEVVGAAMATALSNVISCIYFMILLFVSKKNDTTIISIRLTRHSFEWKIPQKILGAGAPAAVMTFAENISYAILDKLLSGYRILAVQSGVGVAKKINMLTHSIVRGITQGALPLLGYNYSAGKREKTKQIVRVVATFAFCSAMFCAVLMFIFARPLVGIFLDANAGAELEEALNYGVVFLRIFCIGGPFSAIAYAYISFFQAVGHGKESFILALLRKGILDIPLMFILRGLASIVFSPMQSMFGIVSATPMADIICFIVSLILFGRFASSHLAKDKRRKRYNPETQTYEYVE